MMKSLTNQADLCYLYTRTRFPLLTDLVEHHSAEGERSFNADRLGSLASWCAKLPFLFKEDAEYEV